MCVRLCIYVYACVHKCVCVLFMCNDNSES